MNIEILGVDPRNKGAALMLEAVKANITPTFPDARFCVPLSFNIDERLKYGLWSVIPRDTSTKRFISKIVDLFVPQKLLSKVGIIKDKNIDVIIDSSGFAYGDFWGVEKLDKRLGRNVSDWKKQNKKIILLPQAWGPFDNEGFKPVLNKVVGHADIMFARDKQSLGFVQGAVGDSHKNLFQAPDFTCLLEANASGSLLEYNNSTFVIPNEKVIKSFGQASRKMYLDYLCLACKKLIAQGHSVVLLNHEGKRDAALAEEILNLLGKDSSLVKVLSLDNPIATKFVLANARAIVSSRFHGLVSALSSGVPSLACGWSHKYEELLADYNCSNYVVDFTKEEEAGIKLEQFLEDCSSDEFRSVLLDKAKYQKQLTEEMWTKVHNVLRS